MIDRSGFLASAGAATLGMTAGPRIGRKPEAALTPPQTEADQVAWFFGRTPNTPHLVQFYAYHYEDDPTPYVLGGQWNSNGAGIVKAAVALGDLAVFYNGGEGPIYEIEARLFSLDGVLLDRTPRTYVGYYPASMWYYQG